jgi:hypothetical protein
VGNSAAASASTLIVLSRRSLPKDFMKKFQCDECQSIYQDLMQNVQEAKEQTADSPLTPRQFDRWFPSISQTKWAQLLSTSTHWDAWRRLQEHSKLTGHSIFPQIFPPTTNAN